MHHISKPLSFLSILALLPTALTTYTLTDDYSRDTFFGNFTAFTASDPTNGFVSYTPYDTAASKQLISTVSNLADASYIGVDPTATVNSGRPSVRISSKKAFNKGLFVLDLLHMPASTCGSWPAFWLLGGGTWPADGEIDIIEGVNMQEKNQMTLHTSAGCAIQSNAAGAFTGQVNTTNCGPDEANTGCAIVAPDTNTYGTGFNTANGGVYATEWTSEGISIWSFPRASIPADITAQSPDPTQWGTPLAKFAGGSSCDIDAHFKDMNIVFNTAFCGDWAGKAWESSGCAAKTGMQTCAQYVGAKGADFKESFWIVNYVRVFQEEEQQQQQGAQEKRMRRRFLRAEVGWEDEGDN